MHREKTSDNKDELWLSLRREDATPEFLRENAKSEIWFIRSAIARNRNTPKDILEILSFDLNATVRWQAAGNTSSPKEVLARLASDQDWDVRYSSAGNTSTPGEMLMALAKDEKILVQFAVVGNPAAPKEVLELLKGSTNTNLSKLAEARLAEINKK